MQQLQVSRLHGRNVIDLCVLCRQGEVKFMFMCSNTEAVEGVGEMSLHARVNNSDEGK